MPDPYGRLTGDEVRAQGRDVARQIALREELGDEARAEREQERAALEEYARAPVEVRERLKADMRRAFDRQLERTARRRSELAAPDSPVALAGDRLYRAHSWGDLIQREVVVSWWRNLAPNPNPKHPAMSAEED